MRQGNGTQLLPYANQSQLFADWKERLDAKLPSNVVTQVYNDSKRLESAFASNKNVVSGLAVDFSSYPEFVEYDVRVSAILLAGQIPTQKSSSTEFTYGNLLGGAENFANSGFSALQVLAEETLGNTLAAEMGATSLERSESSTSLKQTRDIYGNNSFSLHVSAARTPYAELDNFKWISQAPIFLTLCFGGVVGLFSTQIAKERLSGQLAYWRVLGMSTRAYWIGQFVDVTLSITPIIFLTVAWTGIIGFWGPGILWAIANIVLFVCCSIPVTLLIGAMSPDVGLSSLFNALYFILPLLGGALVGAPQGARLAICILAPFNFLFGSIEILKRRALSIMGETEAVPATLAAIPAMDPLITIGFFVIDMILYWGLALLVIYLRHRGATAIPPATSALAEETVSKQRAGNDTAINASDSDADRVVSLDDSVSDAEDAAQSSFKMRAASPLREQLSALNLVINASDLFTPSSNPEKPKLLVDRLQIEPGIYALIGLGKSDLMSALCDLTRPHSGSLQVLGYDMYQNKTELLGHVAVCPKADFYCETLSGLSHVELAARLSLTKSIDDVTYRVRSIIEELGLAGVAQASVETYSAGEKRLLMLACALVVPARVVFLDEVSSGMCHEQRTLVWKAIMKRRTEDNMTFVMTSEHMDEVEMLAERIGVMHNGVLIREGSLDYLMGQIESLPRPDGEPSVESAAPSTTLDLATDIELLEANRQDGAISSNRGLRTYFDQLKTALDPSVAVHQQRGSPISSPPMAQGNAFYPQNARGTQKFSQLWRQHIMSKLRNGPVIRAFCLVPVILGVIAMSTARGSASSLYNIPTVVGKLQATTTPIPLSNISRYHAVIPFDGPPSFSNQILQPWFGSNVTFEHFSGAINFNKALWHATGLRYPEGGLFVQDTASSGFSYSVAYNRTEVYSVARLVNWVNNAAFSYFLTTVQGIPAPQSNLTDPFLRLRSVPFAPRAGETINTMPGLRKVVELIAPATVNCSFQLVLAMAILSCILGMQLVIERSSGYFGMLRRAGMSLPSYWSYTMLFNVARFIFSALLMVSISSSFSYEFLKGPAFLIYCVSLVMTTLAFMMLAFMAYRYSDATTIIRNIMHFHVMLSILPGMFSQLGPAAFGKIGWLHWLGDIIQYIYFIYPTAIFPEMLPKIAYKYAEAGFKYPSFSALFSGEHSLTWPFIAIFLHLAGIFIFFATLEYLNSWSKREEEEAETVPNFHSPENPVPTVSGGLPAYAPLQQDSNDHVSLTASAEQLVDIESGSALGLEMAGCESRGLRRRFNGMPRAAVESLTLSVPFGSSYALVGPPSCGKSTVLRIMSGIDASNDGEALLAGRYVVGAYQTDVYGTSRLCTVLEPNCFNRWMTPRETINVFLAMRNDLTQFNLEARTTHILERAMLTEDADKILNILDMSVKRVLVAAIATLTYNEVIMLDEPTKDCDFATRKMVLSLLSEAINEKHAAILITSNTLDEAAQLCERVGLMVNGQLACQGRLTELEAACSGYELRISFCDRNTDALGVTEYLGTLDLLALIETNLLRGLVHGLHRVEVDDSCAKGMSSCANYDLPRSIDVEATTSALNDAVSQGKILSFKLVKTNLAAVASRLAKQQLDDYSRVAPQRGLCN